MDKTPWYTAEGVTSYDLNNMPKDAQKGLAWLAASLLGSTGTVVNGFAASQTLTPSLSINIGAGNIYQLAAADADPIGSFAADSTQILQQGFAAAQTIALNASGLSAGQAKWWLVQAQFEQEDQIRSGDPTGGVRGFYNSENPTNPLNGIDGLGGTVPTVRLGFANVSAIAGTPATAGSAVPPNPSSGCVPLFLIEVTFGQTAITNGEIQQAGPGVYSGYSQAPFLAGLLNQHHLGIAGQAPPIDLTREVQNVLPLANAPGSSSAADGYFSTERMNGVNGFALTGNPNGHIAGALGDTYIDSIAVTAWKCTTAGNSSTAVWTQMGAGLATVISSFGSPVVLATPGDYVLNAGSAGSGSQTVTLPSSAGPCRIVRKDSNSDFALTVQGPSGIPILTGNLTLYNQGEAASFMTDGSDYYRVS